jgi:GNAT superfamily N-acetyltransferase
MTTYTGSADGLPVFRVARLDDSESLRLLADYESELAEQGIVLDRHEGGGVGAEEMVVPQGIFLLVELDHDIVACGGIRRLSEDIAEIKRMYVAPTARGRGIARALLARLENEACALGCRVARLDTGRDMVAALTLYREVGYREIPDYNGNPHAAHWMEKALQEELSHIDHP